ncbi:MAG: Sua5/YciO/YrdC/YwlC family protein [Parcubacteria group bacterium GW2011_GWA2_39_18]|nr:MAG: Sua5/YciO/YrdC/YwlC family protein [Parcubacteria group bacterium GW2011_GWA2_39_18]
MEIKHLQFELNKSYLRGKTFIYPTDTCYGLGCLLSDEEAIKKIHQIKKRDAGKPLSIMVLDKTMFKRYGQIDKNVEILIDKYLPGALTIIVPKGKKIPNFFNEGFDSVGIRIPNNKFCLKLIKIAKEPIITTSANISGENNLYRPTDILNEFSGKSFNERPDIFFNDGDLSEIAPSTIVKPDDGKFITVRQGGLKI